VRLLVSVSNAGEALAAAAGGADIIDAKDPRRGALGAVTPAVFDSIRRAIAQQTSAALGDAADDLVVERDARAFHQAGASFVKIGFDRIPSATRGAELITAALRGAPAAVVAVAYADAGRTDGVGPDDVLDAAVRAGAAGILFDTADKSGPGLCDLVSNARLTSWVTRAHDARLFAAVAGKLRAIDLGLVRDAGADIAGVRGAACDGGRIGIISTSRVRALRDACA
jgi:uncharacterized protein (UPF0264 family)